jgi:hypothetical protein
MNNNTMNGNKGKTFANVVFLMAQNPNNDRWEPMAYFPDIDWDFNGNKTSYMHNGQHGPCCEAFALLDCRAPRKHEFAAVARLQEELRSIGYVLTPLDSNEWLKSKAARRVELDRNVYEATAITDSALMIEANMNTGKRKRANRAA